MTPKPGIDSTLATVMMLAVLALGFGGVQLYRKGDRQKGVLMIVCAVVVMANLVIWTV